MKKEKNWSQDWLTDTHLEDWLVVAIRSVDGVVLQEDAGRVLR
jgi:hypothetical protein